MRSKTIRFRTIAIVILLIASAPLLAARDRSAGKNRDDKRRPEVSQQQRGDRHEENRPGRNFDGSGRGGERYIDRMHPNVEGLIPEPLKEKLNLTEKQKKQLIQIHKEQAVEIKELSEEMLELREELKESVFEEVRESEIRKIARKMGSIIGDIAVIRSSGYAVLTDILSEEQLDIINDFREERLEGAEDFRKRMKGHSERRHERGGPGEVQRRGGPGEVQRRGGPGEVQRRGGPGEVQRRGAGERPNHQIIFDKRDSNDDGKLTPDEMGGKEKSQRFFDNFDTNKDGVVTIKEFRRMGEDRPGNMGKRGKREPKDDNN